MDVRTVGIILAIILIAKMFSLSAFSLALIAVGIGVAALILTSVMTSLLTEQPVLVTNKKTTKKG